MKIEGNCTSCNTKNSPSGLWALTFAWNFRVGFLGQMEQLISSVKNGSKYDAVPFVINNPIELSRLGRLVPGSQSRRPWVREWHALVRFLQMVQLIPVILVETNKRGIPSKAFLLFQKFSLGWTIPFDTLSEKQTNSFSVQMVSAPSIVKGLSGGGEGRVLYMGALSMKGDYALWLKHWRCKLQ